MYQTADVVVSTVTLYCIVELLFLLLAMDSIIFAAKVQCHLDHDDPVTHILLITRFSVISLALLMLVASLWYKEVYLFFLSIALKLDIYLNELLADVIIKQSAPRIGCNDNNPALSALRDPMSVYGMPSDLAEHVYFFVTVALTYALLWRIRLGFLSVFSLLGYAALTCTAQVVLRFNSPWQVVAGAGVGVAYGLLYQLFIFYAVSPYFPWIISTRVFSYLGYKNHMCGSISRFKLHGNLSDALNYFSDVIWPIVLYVVAPYMGSQTPIDLYEVEQRVLSELQLVYNSDEVGDEKTPNQHEVIEHINSKTK